MNIEDRILKRNVPGRCNESDEDESENNFSVNRCDDSISYGKYPSAHNTGVKGVLADFNSHQVELSDQAELIRLERETALRRIASGNKVSSVAKQAENSLQQSQDDYKESVDDDDDDFLKAYRDSRLQELKRNHYRGVQKVFGKLKYVDNVSLVPEIEERNTTTVVHIFEPSVQASVTMNVVLELVAEQLTQCKFLSVHNEDCCISIDRVALPILAIYRDGELITVLAGLEQELGIKFSDQDLKWLLETTFANFNISY